MEGKPKTQRRARRRVPPLRSCVGSCGTLGRSWSLHFLCDTCRDELPETCWKCAAPLDGRLVCRSCGHRNGSAARNPDGGGHNPSTAAIPY